MQTNKLVYYQIPMEGEEQKEVFDNIYQGAKLPKQIYYERN